MHSAPAVKAIPPAFSYQQLKGARMQPQMLCETLQLTAQCAGILHISVSQRIYSNVDTAVELLIMETVSQVWSAVP